MTGRLGRPGIAVAALTVIGFALRVIGIDQSLFGDEAMFTHPIVTGNSLFGMFGDIVAEEITPPLYFVLAWLAAQVGDPVVWIRVPSLLLSTATIPLVYVLGSRTVGRPAGIAAAALMALSPFAIFYGDEARAYATLMFFSTLSTLALLGALEKGGGRRWLGYSACITAILYTHYSGAFVVLGQAAWTLWAHRERARQIGLACAGAGLAFLPWLPSFLDQREQGSVQAGTFTIQYPLAPDTVVELFARLVPGSNDPSFAFVPLAEMPGKAVVAAFWVTLGLALAIHLARLRPRPGRVAPGPALIVVLALITPLGLILYSLQPDTSYLVARNASASLPMLAILVGLVLTSLPGRASLAATAIVLAAVGVGAAKTLDEDHRRPAYRDVASVLDRTAGPGDTVLQPLDRYGWSDSFTSLELHLERPHNVPPPGTASQQVWDEARRGARAFVVVTEQYDQGAPLYARRLGPAFSLEGRRRFPGLLPLLLYRYERTRAAPIRARLVPHVGADVLVRPGHGDVRVATAERSGFVDAVAAYGRELSVTGWAVDPVGGRPATRVFAFDGVRAVLAGRPTAERRDIADLLGQEYLKSGFSLSVIDSRAGRMADGARLQFVAVADGRAWEIPSGESTDSP